MTEKEKESLQYRFRGYPPPLIQLDSTGPGYWLQWYTHPYYSNQPKSWSQSAFMSSGVTETSYPRVQSTKNDGILFSILPVCKNNV